MKIEEKDSDEILVDRYNHGDTAAFDEVVSRYWDRIFYRAFSLLNNREDAEEVAQDTFIRAQKALSQFRGDSSFSTWLFQISTNLSRNRYWYWWRRKRESSVSMDQNISDDSDTTLGDVLKAEGETPGEAAITNEFVARIGDAMKLLTTIHREALVLRNVHNLSYDEIASELNISVGTVKSRVARARESLKHEMGPDFQSNSIAMNTI